MARSALKLLIDSWAPSLVAFVVAANFLSSELAYSLLAAEAAYLLLSRGLEPKCRGPGVAAASALIVASSQLPLARLVTFSRPSPLHLAFVAAAAVCEELYFRGVLLPDLGLLPQAFAFALAHLRLSDPVSLVESALLLPHYLLLGVALGLAAELCGYPASAAAHALYNAVAVSYTLPLDVSAVALLLAGDAAASAALALLGGSLKKRGAKTPRGG